MDAAKLDYIARTFDAFVSQNNARLRRGLNRRNKIKEQLQKGENVDNYRVQFIKESAVQLVQDLKTIAQNFNARYDDDMASSLDLIDIIQTAQEILKGETGI